MGLAFADPSVAVDGKLVTGQNPASSEAAAKEPLRVSQQQAVDPVT